MAIKTFCPVHGLIKTEETMVFGPTEYFRSLGQTHFCPKCGSPTKIVHTEEKSTYYWAHHDEPQDIDVHTDPDDPFKEDSFKNFFKNRLHKDDDRKNIPKRYRE
jgi:hypothetical protein